MKRIMCTALVLAACLLGSGGSCLAGTINFEPYYRSPKFPPYEILMQYAVKNRVRIVGKREIKKNIWQIFWVDANPNPKYYDYLENYSVLLEKLDTNYWMMKDYWKRHKNFTLLKNFKSSDIGPSKPVDFRPYYHSPQCPPDDVILNNIHLETKDELIIGKLEVKKNIWRIYLAFPPDQKNEIELSSREFFLAKLDTNIWILEFFDDVSLEHYRVIENIK